jgi:crossover junction endodeoxyribonuclease RuvC
LRKARAPLSAPRGDNSRAFLVRSLHSTEPQKTKYDSLRILFHAPRLKQPNMRLSPHELGTDAGLASTARTRDMSGEVLLGIDPGTHGAVVGLNESGQILWIEDTPSTTEVNGRTATNAPLLTSILARSRARIAYCEFVGARPTDAKVAAFAFGRSRGVIEGVCGALSIPIVFITPPVWKRLADIPPGVEHKDLARTRAIARWPARAEWFARKCDVDRAEACLIGLAGLQRETRHG